MLTRLGVVLALALVPGVALAQRSLPLLSADGLLGVTVGPSRIGADDYHRTATAARVAVALRLGSRGAVRPVLVVDYSGMPGHPPADDLCLMGNNTPCPREIPEYSGFGAGLGVRAALSERFTVGATAGLARYEDRYTTSTSRRTATRFDADVAARMSRRIGLVLNVRHVELPRVGASRAWFRPITVGLRIQ